MTNTRGQADPGGIQQKYLSISEASEYLGVSHDTLKRWESKGMINPYRTPSNHRKYTIAQLDDVINQYNTI